MFLTKHISRHLSNRRAQLLLPAVLLLPLFVLVIYLLIETTKVSIAKVRHQFALDNAAYTQVSSVSTFLNAVGLLNGPLPYRVLKTYDDDLTPVNPQDLYHNQSKWTVFDLFFQAGAVPTVAPDYDAKARENPAPKPDSTDWGVYYVKNSEVQQQTDESGNPLYDRSSWEKESPAAIKDTVHFMNKDMVEKYYVSYDQIGKSALMAYLTTYVQVGDTFNLQKGLYQKLIKNAAIFREGYYLNVDDCKMGECARQSASRLMQFLSIPTKRQEADKLMFYISQSSGNYGGSGGAIELPFTADQLEIDPLFLFAYVEPAGRARLRAFKRGILLKQNFSLPRNNFNVDLVRKYKPYVRNTVILNCPRANNNCVWPNPLPKYNVILRP
ncbi:MAG: hypothetical protein IKW71_02060 [Elusimicrobiaceae bacterium]|nr:hypothetical protein [Elusimicrobiaceae bacterium]